MQPVFGSRLFVGAVLMRRFGSLRAFPLLGQDRKEIGSVGNECAYCGVALAEARCIRRRRSTGFGRANVVIERFCERRCRGLFDERGPRDEARGAGVRGRLPTHRSTLAPYRNQDQGENEDDADSSGSTAGSEAPA
jgi:hypothetical protein